MYYVLKVGSVYLGMVNGRAMLVARQRLALRFDVPFARTESNGASLRFVKVTPRLSPADALPDDAAVQEQIHADIDAFTSESDAEYLNPPF